MNLRKNGKGWLAQEKYKSQAKMFSCGSEKEKN